MGLFDAKMCELCGEKAGMLTKLKLSEGFLCSKCKKKLSGFSSGWSARTISDVNAHLQAREANRAIYSSFVPDMSAGPDQLFRVDSRQGAFVFAFGKDWTEGNPTVFGLNSLMSVKIVPAFDVFQEDADDDGVPDRFDRTPGTAQTAQGFAGSAIGQAMGLGQGSFDAVALQNLVMSSGMTGAVEIGTDSRDMHGFPREVRSFVLKFTMNDPHVQQVTWNSMSVDGKPTVAMQVFQQCAEVVGLVQRLKGMPAAQAGFAQPAFGQPGFVQQPNAFPQQAGFGQPGAYPQQQPGFNQPGAYPQQPGFTQPGAYPQQPGAYPGM
ncbi:DUF4428 domain-containing protein [Schaalia hyovaginalis]|uniref:DUF4428 domain-containing protein n=1 Tax=Schaalia hyovaginalis TaxID=29316 RepID=UPI0023F9D6A8|nr:DUF4428 domain-containing protein [Schaalia hyovaginalis]MCI7672413.1 DUF4428 domain-containing protein [Schaalia hyovaginalis]